MSNQIKLFVSMKYLFIIGDQAHFDSANFRAFLSYILQLEGSKPFQMFLYKFTGEILRTEYPYLTLEGQQKKYLALYPNMMLRLKDLKDNVPEAEGKNTFQLLVAGLGELGQVIKADQIEALGVHKILLIWDK